MLKSIAIIELYQHDEVLRHYCEMLCDSDFKIKVFCSKTVFENTADFRKRAGFDWEVKEKGEKIPEFLKRNHKAFQSSDLIFITTALTNFKAFYKITKQNKTLLLVHNAHSFLAYDQHYYFGDPIVDRLRWLKLFFNRTHFYKMKMVRSLSGLAFPSKIILDYVKEKMELPAHLKLMSLPFVYAEPRNKIQEDRITITIPCTVVSEIRDYDSVFQAFLKIRNRLNEKIRIVLLGQPKKDGWEIVKTFLSLKNTKIEVVCFEELIPGKIYREHLQASDFLILPLKKYGRNHIYQERLGFSKISGGINDMIRFGIPALIPDHYPLGSYLRTITEPYLKGKLNEKLEEWIKEKKYLNLRKKADYEGSDFSRKVIKEQFFSCLKEL